MSVEANTRKPYPWRAVTFWLFVVVLLGVLGYFGHIFYERKQAERQLEQVTAELDRDDPGWRFEDIEAAREKVPDAENGALVVESAYKKLTRYWPYPLADKFDELDPYERLGDDTIKAIATELIREKAALVEARRLREFDKGYYTLEHRPDPSRTVHHHYNWIPVVLHLLRLDVEDATAQQDFTRAIRTCEAMAGPYAVSVMRRRTSPCSCESAGSSLSARPLSEFSGWAWRLRKNCRPFSVDSRRKMPFHF
jgi:hypothetical protein